jgi:branched-chain amino acid transport system permease protein
VVSKYKKLLLAGGSLLVLAVLPIFFHSDEYVMNILILALIWAVMASSWDLILGYANIFSFGQLSFFVIGAYTSGLLANYVGLSPWLGLIVGGLVAGAVGFLIGVPCLRLQGMYLAIVTFSLQFVLPTLITYFGPGRLPNFTTGGTWGLNKVPAPNLFGYVFTRSNPVPWFYLALVFFILFMTVIYLIIKSPIGLAFVALRDAEPLAKISGVDEYRYKLLVFAISSCIAGITGAFYVHYFSLISPASMTLDVFLILLIMLLFGGLGVFPGAAIGAFAITFINELLRPTLEWRLVVLGAIVILTMMYLPKGLMGVPDAVSGLYRRWTSGRRPLRPGKVGPPAAPAAGSKGL